MPISDATLPAELESKAADMDKQAKALVEASQKLRDAASVLRDGCGANGAPRRSPGRPPSTGLTRVQQLRQFVESRGDVSRKEALEESGMPQGTAGALLTRKHGFRQNKDGRWYVPEETK